MKDVLTEKSRLTHTVFTEVARLAYEGGGSEVLDELPYRIITGGDDPFRDTIFLERAIVGERIRVAMGMSLRHLDEHAPVSRGVDESMIEERYYEPPLIDIIQFACNACPDNRVFITDGCQNCLEHPCREVCPKKCISGSGSGGRSVIDQDECIKCGRCIKSCQYNAIIRQERPCVKACGIKAIGQDEYGHAKIDQEKCVSCGMCLNSCPFAAIVDKGQIYQTVKALLSDTPVYAIVAPALAGQFGKDMTGGRIRGAFAKLGFEDVYEVAVGADLCTIEESEHFLREVPSKLPFMCTSCCPAWSVMAKKEFPEYADTVSMALTPMVLTARLVKKYHPDCRIAFIGPCLSKKHEAVRQSVKSYVDFVLTFEELAGMFEARNVVFADIEEGEPPRQASSDGIGFAVSGGVAEAVSKHIRSMDPEREVRIEKAEGLDECYKMLKKAAAGQYDGYLLEGMACPGGCVGGAGTLQPVAKATHSVNTVQDCCPVKDASSSQYADLLPILENIQQELSNES